MLVPRTLNATVHGVAPLDRLFEDLFHDVPAPEGRSTLPAVNVWEDDSAYFVEATVPGVDEKALDITVLGKELKIEGKVDTDDSKDERNFHRREWGARSFTRTFAFPLDIDSTKIDAETKNGVLRITLPKAEAALPRKIEVKGF